MSRAREPFTYFHEELSTVDLDVDRTPIDDAPPRRARLGQVLLVEDDVLLGEALCFELEPHGYEVVFAGSSDVAERALSAQSFDVVVSDIVLPGTSGLGLARSIRAKDRDQPIILITGDNSIEHAVAAVEVGAFRFMLKPLDTRALEDAVGEALRERRRAVRARQILDSHPVATTEDLIELDLAIESMWMAYQPIVEWHARRVVGREALLRSTSPRLSGAPAIIGAAKKLEHMKPLGRAIRAEVCAALDRVPSDELFFINISGEELVDDAFFDEDDPLFHFASRIVLELSEDIALDRIAELAERIAVLRARGYRFALDDLGAAYAGLNSLALLRPEFVKLDMQLTRNIDRDLSKQEIVRSVISLCRRTSMSLIAEGVETTMERDTLLRLGCDLFQGYLFARPTPKLDCEIAW